MTDPSSRRTALITGASKGIGRALTHLFARDRYDLVLVARSEDLLRALAEELSAAHGIQCRVEACDLTAPDAPPALAARLAEDGVEIDVLVNNAGFGAQGTFHESPYARQLGQIQLNIAALTALTHLLLPPMVARGRGRVLNLASTAGFQPGPYMAVYYATKAYVVSFSQAIGHELRGTGVTVTAHCPGATESEFGAVSGNDKTLLFRTGNVASAQAVAAHAYAAMNAGRPVAIHGVLNWLLAQANRLTPRALLLPIVARVNT